eukprot:285697-Ditylum_brightwellii.AAC.1
MEPSQIIQNLRNNGTDLASIKEQLTTIKSSMESPHTSQNLRGNGAHLQEYNATQYNDTKNEDGNIDKTSAGDEIYGAKNEDGNTDKT